MATLYISEFTTLATHVQTGTQIAQMPPVAEQTRSISGSTAQSSAFNIATRFVQLHTDAICSISIGSNPTATTSTMRLPADTIIYFGVTPGDKVAVITNT